MQAELGAALRRLAHSESGIDFVSIFPLAEDYPLPRCAAALRATRAGAVVGGLTAGAEGAGPDPLWRLRAATYLLGLSVGEVEERDGGVWRWLAPPPSLAARAGDALLLAAGEVDDVGPRDAAAAGGPRALTVAVRSAESTLCVAVVADEVAVRSYAASPTPRLSPSDPTRVRVVALPGSFGAEVEGLDLAAAPLSPPLFALVVAAFHRHRLLLFRGQHALQPDAETAFISQFNDVASDPGIVDLERTSDSAKDNSAQPLAGNPMTICQGRGVRLVNHHGVSASMGHSYQDGSGLRATRHWHSE